MRSCQVTLFSKSVPEKRAQMCRSRAPRRVFVMAPNRAVWVGVAAEGPMAAVSGIRLPVLGSRSCDG